MKPYKIDLTGNRYGRLVVVSYYGKKKCGNSHKTMWLCRCDCGTEKAFAMGDLRSGHSTSCGCVHKEMVGKLNRTHNLSNKCGRLYPLWKSLKHRCYCITSKDYANYGGRGIKVCDEWKDDFQAFYDWAIENGYKEEKTDKGLNVLTIDRIDVNGNYEPNNCRFITNKEQSLNKRNSLTEEERHRICPICGRDYIVFQRNGTKTCGKKCGKILGLQTRKRNELQESIRNQKTE